MALLGTTNIKGGQGGKEGNPQIQLSQKGVPTSAPNHIQG